jgi:hypothetical protein
MVESALVNTSSQCSDRSQAVSDAFLQSRYDTPSTPTYVASNWTNVQIDTSTTINVLGTQTATYRLASTSSYYRTGSRAPGDGKDMGADIDAMIAAFNGPVGSESGVVWTSVVNATATGNSLQKTGGCENCQDAGGVSQQQIVTGTGYVQFTPGLSGTPGPALYAGLGHNLPTPPAAAQVEYAFDFWPGNVWEVRELGVYKAQGTFAAGDVFKIAIEAGPTVKYYKNGALVYQTLTTP